MELNKIYNEDCLEGMKRIPDKSVDCIICDLPYGTTACKWDIVIPFDKLWEQYNRIIKDNGAICLFGAQPFTSVLVNSNIKCYKHHWIWDKGRGTGFQVARYRPMMQTEDIIVFSCGRSSIIYNPQMIKLDKPKKYTYASSSNGTNPLANFGKKSYEVTHKHPTNIISIKKEGRRIHPTQKPTALIEYLIKTYSNEGETILDNCMGSGTTAIACINTNRNYIGFELDKGYYDIAVKRIEEHLQKHK